MRKLIRTQAESYCTEHRKKKSWLKVVTALSAVVVFCTTYALILPAITMERETLCGMEEHVHTDECFAEVEIPEERNLICEQEEDHIHCDACFEIIPAHTQTQCICGLEEHTHTDACRDAPKPELSAYVCGFEYEHTHDESCYNGDYLICTLAEHTHDETCLRVEAPTEEELQIWLSQFKGKKGCSDIGGSILALAQSQLDYREMTVTGKDNEPVRYSHFGAWAGDSEADWNLSFVALCAKYGGLTGLDPDETIQDWIDLLAEQDLFIPVGEGYEPVPGDILFTEDRAGVICEVSARYYTVIEGDVDGAVQEVFYPTSNEKLLGFACTCPFDLMEDILFDDLLEMPSLMAAPHLLNLKAANAAGSSSVTHNGNTVLSKALSPYDSLTDSYKLTIEALTQGSTLPLDIAVVLDTSGSMDWTVGGEETSRKQVGTYDNGVITTTDPEYVFDWENKAYQIGIRERVFLWYYERNYYDVRNVNGTWQHQRSRDRWVDIGSRTGIIYELVPGTPESKDSRLAIAQNLLNNFCDVIHNDAVKNNMEHHINLYTFDSNASTVFPRAAGRYTSAISNNAFDGTNVTLMKNAINALSAGGATYPSSAMQAAYNALHAIKRDSIKVLLFFTDGMPGDSSTESDWSYTEATNTMGYAWDMKQDGVYVFSVGVFNSTPPETVEQYMGGISSHFNPSRKTDITGGTRQSPNWLNTITADSAKAARNIDPAEVEAGKLNKFYFLALEEESVKAATDSITSQSINFTHSLNEDSILHDPIMEQFKITDIKKTLYYLSSEQGQPEVWKEYTELGDPDKAAAQAILNNVKITPASPYESNTIEITNFDYFDNAVMVNQLYGKEGDTLGRPFTGFKLSVTATLKANQNAAWDATDPFYCSNATDTEAGKTAYLLDENKLKICNLQTDSPKASAYAVTYVAEGADAGTVPETKYYLPGVTVTKAATLPTKNGVSATAWTDPADLTVADNGTFVMPESDVTFEVQWEPDAYTVTVKKEVDGIESTQDFPFTAVVITEEGESDPITFELANGEDYDLSVPSGASVRITETSHGGYYVKFYDGSAYYPGDSYTLDAVSADAELTVINTAGSTLPSTGGIGRTSLYLIGILLITGAVVFGYAPRRKRERGSD